MTIIVLGILSLIGLITSCSDSFLSKEPLGVTSETVFYNEKGINSLLIGTYGIISGVAPGVGLGGGSSIQNWVWGSVTSDDAYKGSEFTDQVTLNAVERWEMLPDNDFVAQKWRATIGVGVDRCNSLLKVLNQAEDVDESIKSKLRGEVLFLRAFFNYEAWQAFGNIPLITEDIEDPSMVTNQNPKGEVLNQIIYDLEYAWKNLPEKQAEVGRPTRYAAMALAAKAYMQELDFAKAKPLLDNIINSGQFQLMPNFMDNYRIATNNNVESIFEIQASVNDGSSSSLNGEMGIGLNFTFPSEMGLCCGFHQVSQNLVNAYKVDEKGLPLFDTFDDTDLKSDQGVESTEEFIPYEGTVDPRLDWTVSRRGIPLRDWGINPGERWIRSQSYAGPYQPAIKPFYYKSEKGSLSTTSGWRKGISANNFRYLRYTHILLWRAEIAVSDGDLALALNFVNMIRERAGNEVVMGKVLIHNLPAVTYPWGEGTSDEDYMSGGDVDWSQPAANYLIGAYTSFASPKEAMRAVQWEQRLEFATEGARFFDLRRWDKHTNPDFRVDMAKTLNDFAANDLRTRNSMKDAVFTEKAKLLPIPRNQIELQGGILVQNPGY